MLFIIAIIIIIPPCSANMLPPPIQAVGARASTVPGSQCVVCPEGGYHSCTGKEWSEWLLYRLDSPATCERIRMACQDKFVQQVCVCGGVVLFNITHSFSLSIIIMQVLCVVVDRAAKRAVEA